MKQSVSPVVAVIVILAVLGVAAFAIFRGTAAQRAGAGDQPTGMPPSVAEEFKKRMDGNMTGPPGQAQPGGGMPILPPSPKPGGGR